MSNNTKPEIQNPEHQTRNSEHGTQNTEFAIKVSNLTKVYHLYDKPQDRLKEALNPFKKSYHHDFYALNDVSFEIKKGETVGIIGKNGAGKSTLLKIITGVLTPTSGEVQVNGKIASLLELGAGFNPEMTGLENIYLNGTLMGFTKEEMDSKIDAIIDFADLGEFIYHPVKMYSSGMYARLGFSVSINVKPDILIVDEALAVGDMNFQAKCMTAMDRIKQTGTTILFVSHDIGSVKSLCAKGIFIKDGKLVAQGKASDIAELYIKEMREELNSGHQKFSRTPQAFTTENENKADTNTDLVSQEFKTSPKFEKYISTFRYGSGEAKITYAELLDENGEALNEVDFNQSVTIRIYFQAFEELEASVNYYIADEKKIYLLGGGPRLFGADLIKMEPGGQYIADFKTRLPLLEGNYSINLEITSPVVINETAKFIDVIDNAVVFKVNRRQDVRLWAKMYIPNTFSVAKV